MSRGQRLGFLAVAVAIAIVAVVLLGGRDEDEATTAASATPVPTETVPQEASPVEEPPQPRPPLLTAGEATVLEARQGETVRFRVRHPTADRVHVHGYDRYEDVPAGETVTIAFDADIPGIFEIELEDAATTLASLRVEP